LRLQPKEGNDRLLLHWQGIQIEVERDPEDTYDTNGTPTVGHLYCYAHSSGADASERGFIS